jgi:hypothetical protein
VTHLIPLAIAGRTNKRLSDGDNFSRSSKIKGNVGNNLLSC